MLHYAWVWLSDWYNESAIVNKVPIKGGVLSLDSLVSGDSSNQSVRDVLRSKHPLPPPITPLLIIPSMSFHIQSSLMLLTIRSVVHRMDMQLILILQIGNICAHHFTIIRAACMRLLPH